MAEPKADALVKSLESLVAEKQAVTGKEKELIDGLNAVLSQMGYRVVAATQFDSVDDARLFADALYVLKNQSQ